MPIKWVRRFFGDAEPRGVLQLFTPQAAAHHSSPTRLVLAGLSVGALAVAGSVALSAFLVMLAAVGAIYFLATQVLGLSLEVDPAAFVQRAQAYAQNIHN